MMRTDRLTAAALAMAVALAAGEATAGGGPLDSAEREVMGTAASGSWQAKDFLGLDLQQVGGQGLGNQPEIGSGGLAPRPGEDDSGGGISGEKVKAGLLSLVLPGAGQYYNGQKSKAYVMAGIEAGIWTAWIVFDKQGDNNMESAREYAGIYAQARGSHPESWWQAVGRYMDSDRYEDYLRREARATGEPLPDPFAPGDTWQWVNEDRKYNFQKLRADGNAAYDRRDFMILFAVVNRAVSVYDAVRNAGSHTGEVQANVLGMNLAVGVDPSFTDPGAHAVFSRSF
ncbi:MAG TPA: DUF5683 domain-containing protein [Candidatus Krumholzibacteria bacterium]|nr:DUF5683 domain-containing protein [Candidatus Krumholzibacteria bacterium]